ncbi:MAG TPA: DUF3417 domain-containing protein, partial [Blastocatellia bacterium]|nr:DUF3417 domain-containing protein [Blastocatellia bacterium]
VVPEFYTRTLEGIPIAWVERMRQSMAKLTASFSANRTVREYTEQQYLPRAAAYRARAANKGALGRQIAEWRLALAQNWSGLRFGELKVTTSEDRHMFEIEVYLNGLRPDDVRVELYANPLKGDAPIRQEMSRGAEAPGSRSGYIYRAEVHAEQPASDYTPRIIPSHEGVSVPLEARNILWQK